MGHYLQFLYGEPLQNKVFVGFIEVYWRNFGDVRKRSKGSSHYQEMELDDYTLHIMI